MVCTAGWTSLVWTADGWWSERGPPPCCRGRPYQKVSSTCTATPDVVRMPLPGAAAAAAALARPSACLRCQLCAVLLSASHPHPHPRTLLRPLHQQCRPFTSRPQRHEQDTPPWARGKWRDDRIVGKKGKRQRVVTEVLQTESLSQPTSIVVFQDIYEDPLHAVDRHASPPSSASSAWPALKAEGLTAEDVKGIEDVVNKRYVEPLEAEVNQSIDALKPDNIIVDADEFRDYSLLLQRSYNARQLSRYLASALPVSAVDSPWSREFSHGTVEGFGTWQWHSHREETLSSKGKSSKKGPKAKVIERILRYVWRLRIRSEEQEEGTLDISLPPSRAWQLSLLFDLSHDDRPYYQHFITTPVLLKTVAVDARRSENTMRFKGPRSNAEEAAQQLAAPLLGNVESLQLNLGPLIPALERRGRCNDHTGMFRSQDLQYICDLTKAVIIVEDNNTLAIYSTSESRKHSARRLLISLLDLPLPMSFDGSSEVSRAFLKDGTHNREATLFDVPSGLPPTGLHRRYHNLGLTRKVKALDHFHRDQEQTLTTVTGDVAAVEYDSISRILTEELEAVPTPSHGQKIPSEGHSYWRDELRLSDWKVDFCKILDPRFSSSVTTSTARPIIQHQVPGVQSLLPNFESSELPQPLNEKKTMRGGASSSHLSGKLFDRRMPYLVLHFVPSPSALSGHQNLPRIDMRFRISAAAATEDSRELQLVGMRAIVDEQRLSCKLPDCSVDMLFTRQTSVISKPGVGEDEHVRAFQRELQESVQKKDGALIAPPELLLRLPRWLMTSHDPERGHAEENGEVRYLFERFEQVQNVDFVPAKHIHQSTTSDTETKIGLEGFPADAYLGYREIEGGVIHGSQTMLSLRLRNGLPRVTKSHKRAADPVDTTIETSAPDPGIDISSCENEADAGGKTQTQASADSPTVVTQQSSIKTLASTALQLARFLRVAR